MKYVFLAKHYFHGYRLNYHPMFNTCHQLDVYNVPFDADFSNWEYKKLKVLWSTLHVVYRVKYTIKDTWEEIKSIENSDLTFKIGDNVLIDNRHCSICKKELDVEDGTIYFYINTIYVKVDESSRLETRNYMSKLHKLKEKVEQAMQIIENRKWYEKLMYKLSKIK